MTTPSIPQKRCNKCGQEFPATAKYFYRDRSKRDGLRTDCRACRHKYYRTYYEANRERVLEHNRQRPYNPETDREYGRRYRARHSEKVHERHRHYYQVNRKKISEYRHEYKQNNREKIHQYNQEYRENNREKVAEQKRRYCRANPEKARIYVHQRRARKLANGGSYTAEDERIQLKMQTDRKGIIRCWWCDEPLGNDQSIDHRIPLSRGGSNDARNICIAHIRCNKSKHNKLPHEWSNRLL